jgi:nucleoid-associated protein YejK
VYQTESKAYALQNEKEYFAELTEAYLGKNDFYPFQRQELLNYDKNGYKVLEKVWGKQ